METTTKARAAKLPWWTALLTVTTIALAFVFHSRWTSPVSQWPIDLPTRPYTFVDHPGLRDFDAAAAGERWEGMVYHDWWDTEWRDDEGRRFPRGIDVFHKMHCLVAIRAEFALLATDQTRAAEPVLSRGDVGARGEPRLNVNANHLQHCFDFLRQDILCAADMTLEPLGPGYVETDGQGVEHKCRDWRLLLEHVGLSDVEDPELK